jgi:hypothetical protein
MTSGVTNSGRTHFATVFATARPKTHAAAKFHQAAHSTAGPGRMTRVPTIVAIEFAASWNPLMKSKPSAATKMIATYGSAKTAARSWKNPWLKAA